MFLYHLGLLGDESVRPEMSGSENGNQRFPNVVDVLDKRPIRQAPWNPSRVIGQTGKYTGR